MSSEKLIYFYYFTSFKGKQYILYMCMKNSQKMQSVRNHIVLYMIFIHFLLILAFLHKYFNAFLACIGRNRYFCTVFNNKTCR